MNSTWNLLTGTATKYLLLAVNSEKQYRALMTALGRADRKDHTMIRLICGNCLRLWDAQFHGHRSTCPHCGGALRSH